MPPRAPAEPGTTAGGSSHLTPAPAGSGTGGRRRLGYGLNHAVDQAVLDRLLGREEEVTVRVPRHPFDRLAGVHGDQAVQLVPDPDDLASVDVEVRGLTGDAPPRHQRLVQVDAGIGEREAPALGAGHEDDRPKARRTAHGHGGDRGPYVLHGVVDSEAGGHGAAGRVDVDLDLPLRVLGRQIDQLGHDQVRHHVVDRTSEDDDAIAQQPGVDVEGALTPATVVLDHGGDPGHRFHHRYQA